MMRVIATGYGIQFYCEVCEWRSTSRPDAVDHALKAHRAPAMGRLEGTRTSIRKSHESPSEGALNGSQGH